MHKAPRPLNRETDLDLCLLAVEGYPHGAGEEIVPLVGAEAAAAARDYVIAFLDQPFMHPVAVLAIDQGTNAYVAPDGRWQARYVPAQVRCHPFMLKDVTEDAKAEQRQVVLMIDEAAPQLDRNGLGTPLFDGNQPGKFLQQMHRQLEQLYREAIRTRQQCQQLESLGLLSKKPLMLNTRHGNRKPIHGFWVIDGEKYDGLDARQLLALRKSGALMLLHAHLVSLCNLRDGLLAHKLDHQQGALSAVQLDELFTDVDGDLKFS